MKKEKFTGILLLLLGFVLVLNSSAISITGQAVLSDTVLSINSVTGLVFIALGLAMFVLGSEGGLEKIAGEVEEKKEIISNVKEDKRIYNLAKEIEKKQYIQKEINQLIYELSKGNENPGIGTKKLFGNVSYLRGSHGGRVFYRPKGEGYEILGYAIGTGQGKGKHKSERNVISRLKELYQKENKKRA